MFEKSPKTMMIYLQDGLICLKQLFENASSSLACKENSIGAICRIIYTYSPPMPYQIFVDNLVKIMPFTADQQEEQVALKGLYFLAKKDANLIAPHKHKVIQILENDLANVKKYNIEEPLTGELNKWLSILKSQ